MKLDMTPITGHNTRRDYSMLLQSLPTPSGASGVANLNFLSDHASIRNGSYRKMMNAYYGPDRERVSGIVNRSISTSRDNPKQLREIQNNAEALKKSADALLATGSRSVFNETDIITKDANGVSTTTRGLDTDAIFKAVSSFVTDYNNLLDRGNESNTAGITSRINSLTSMTNFNRNLLGQVGINVGADGKLSINEDDFKKSNMTTVRSLFHGTGSFAFQVSAQASLIDFAAANEAARSNTYNANGAFTNNFSSGNLFGSFF